MNASFRPILVAFLFAILLIASSYYLKGKSIGDWVDAAIYMAAVYLSFIYSVKPNNP